MTDVSMREMMRRETNLKLLLLYFLPPQLCLLVCLVFGEVAQLFRHRRNLAELDDAVLVNVVDVVLHLGEERGELIEFLAK